MGRTRAAKARAQEGYSAADKEVKRSVRKDKKNYIDNLAAQAEAAGQGNLKDLYMITKKLANKFQQTEKSVKDNNGNQLTTTEEQLTRWAEHFLELHKHALQPLQQDLGEGRDPGGVERGHPHQAAKEGGPHGLQQLPRDYALVSARQSSEQNPSRATAQSIVCRPDRQPAHHSGAVTGVELPPIHQLYRLREGIRQRRQRNAVKTAAALWSTREVCLPHPLHLPGNDLQGSTCRPAVGEF